MDFAKSNVIWISLKRVLMSLGCGWGVLETSSFQDLTRGQFSTTQLFPVLFLSNSRQHVNFDSGFTGNTHGLVDGHQVDKKKMIVN